MFVTSWKQMTQVMYSANLFGKTGWDDRLVLVTLPLPPPILTLLLVLLMLLLLLLPLRLLLAPPLLLLLLLLLFDWRNDFLLRILFKMASVVGELVEGEDGDVEEVGNDRGTKCSSNDSVKSVLLWFTFVNMS